MTRSILLTYSALAAVVIAAGMAHVYRWYRWISFGEPMP